MNTQLSPFQQIEQDIKSKPSNTEVALAIKTVLEAVKEVRKKLSNDTSEGLAEVRKELKASERTLRALVSQIQKDVSDEFYKSLNLEVYKLEKQIKDIESYDSTLLETKWATVVEDLHQKVENIKPFVLIPTEIRDALESLNGDERLDIDSIRGWDKVIADLKASGKNVRLVGGTNGIIVYNGTTKIGIVKYINFTGSGVSASLVNGLLTLTFSGGSGGSAFQQPTSGTVNGTNATFVWATAPNTIVVDGGRTIQKVSSDGTVNWTGTTTTVLAIAPNFDVFSSC